MKALGEAAIDLPWLSPCANTLVALARTPHAAVWSEVRSDPGGVLLLVRQTALPSKSSEWSLAPGTFCAPVLLETILSLYRQPGFVDWNQPALAPIYRNCLRQARLAQILGEGVADCLPDQAWIGGLLAPLGWLAVCAVEPGKAVACLQHPSFAQNPQGIQHQLWDLDPTAIARRLCRRWQLPSWLAAILGHLGLPVGIARTLGADPTLFQVVQLAVALVQQEGGGLGLAVGGRLEDLMTGLGLTMEHVEAALAREQHDRPVPPRWEAPATLPWLPDLLQLALENRRQADVNLVERLQNDVDHLQRALEEQCAGEKERLRVAQLKALAEMSAGAGHEINNPLAVISGQAQYLSAQETEPGRLKALNTIVNQALRIHEILKNLMQFARPAPPQPQVIDVAELIRTVTSSLHDQAGERQVRLICPEPPVKYLALADPAQVTVALRALVRNAIEAAPTEGWAGVRVEKTSEGLNLVVEDNGPGPGLLTREHLFDPFYSGRSAGRGRGLGLPTAWRLARQQGGDVRFDGASQGLTRFILSLPAVPLDADHNGNGHDPARNGLLARATLSLS